MNDPAFVHHAIGGLATYSLHSTILLLAVWCATAAGRIRSLTLQEQLWKSAALVPLLTTLLQLNWIEGRPIRAWNISPTAATAGHQKTPASPFAVPSASEPFQRRLERAALPHAEREQFVNANAISARGTHQIPIPQSAVDPSGIEAASHDQTRFGSKTRSHGQDVAADHLERPQHVASAGRVQKVHTSRSSQRVLPDSTGIPWPFRLIVLCSLVLSTGGGLVLLCRFIALTVLLRSATAVTTGRSAEALSRLCQQRGIRKVPRLMHSSQVSEPAAVGIVRPTILLPSDVEARLTDVELTTLLAHELAHLLRRDTLWLWTGQILCWCFAWQPLNRLAVRRWRMLSEYQCDQWATSGCQNARITLARVLTQVAEWKSESRTQLALSATGPPLSQRIHRLLGDNESTDRWQPRRRRIGIMLAAITAIVPGAIFGPRITCAESVEILAGTDVPIVTTREVPPSPVELADSTRDSSALNEQPLLQAELSALAADLDVALELLAQQDSDAELTQCATLTRQKLSRIRSRMNAAED